MEQALGSQIAKSLRIGSHKGANPHHDLESARVQIANHAFWVLEAIRPESPIAIAFLPVVVDHHDPRGITIVNNGFGIGTDVLFILVVDQLNPGVVLRGREQERIRDFPICRKVLFGYSSKTLSEGIPALPYVNRAHCFIQGQYPFREAVPVRHFRPDVAAL